MALKTTASKIPFTTQILGRIFTAQQQKKSVATLFSRLICRFTLNCISFCVLRTKMRSSISWLGKVSGTETVLKDSLNAVRRPLTQYTVLNSVGHFNSVVAKRAVAEKMMFI